MARQLRARCALWFAHVSQKTSGRGSCPAHARTGVGANAAIFSVVYAVLLKPLPFRNPSRLTIIWQADAAHRATGAYFDTYREFEEWKQDSKSFEKLAAITWARVDTTMRLRERLRPSSQFR